MKNSYYQTLVVYLQRGQFLFHLVLQGLLTCFLVWGVKVSVFQDTDAFLVLAILTSWFAGLLGWQLQSFLSNPYSVFLPYVPQIHLLVTAAITLPTVLLLSLPLMLQLSYSILGMASLLTLIFAFFLREGYTGYGQSSILGFLSWILIMIFFSFLPESYAGFTLEKVKQLIASLLAGRASMISFGILVVGAISIIKFGFLILRPDKEDMFEDWEEYLESTTSTTTDKIKKSEGCVGKYWLWLTNSAAEKLDRLSGPIGNGTWNRIRHWQLGRVYWGAPRLLGLSSGALAFSLSIANDHLSTLVWLFIIFFVFSSNFALLAPTEMSVKSYQETVLGYESLRPVTRQKFILQIGLALAFYIFESWFYIWLVNNALAGIAAIWNPTLFYKVIGLWPHLLFFTSLLVGIPGFIGWFAVGESVFAYYCQSIKDKLLITASVLLVIILVCAVIAIAAIYIGSVPINELRAAFAILIFSLFLNYTAYRKWCKMDLG